MTAYLVVACPRCGAMRVAEAERKTASCPRCGARIELSGFPPLLKSASLDEARAFIGSKGAKDAGRALAFAREVQAAARAPTPAREKERARIAAAVGAASGRTNQLKLILRRGFEAFGEIAVEDLARICDLAELPWSGAELAEAALEQGLAARAKSGALVPLREGR